MSRSRHRPLTLLIGLAAALTGCAGAMHPMAQRHAAVIEVPTADGWTIALHHFPPAPGTTPRRHPVILCHGITSNTYTWDLDDRASFAAWLQRRGFDVYALDLRGGGASERPGLFDAHGYTYTFDDYVRYDVPAAIEAVSARSGGRPVHWVGHSMGGMVMYAWLPIGDQTKVRSLTAVGSPPVLPRHVPALTAFADSLPLAGFFFDELPTGTLSTLAAPWADQKRVSALHILWNYDNLRPRTARMLAAHGTANISMGVMRQMAASMAAGRLLSADGQTDYTADMARITAPIFFIAGVLDHLCPPYALIRAYGRVGSETRRIAIMGRAQGAAADYGHLDLTMGSAAPDDVFPAIHDWLVARD